jgi:hypothetical protein
MSRPFVEPIDSSDLENRFSNEDKIQYLRDPDPEDIAKEFAKLEPYLGRLPKREQDLLFMHFIMKKKQTELGIIFNRTQAAISYRIKKAIRRLKFLLSLPEVGEEDIQEDLAQIFDGHDIAIMLGMFRHTCQTQVARDMDSNQCYIRHRFHKNIRIIKQHADLEDGDVYVKYHDLFSKIRDNTNILREVKLSRWDNGDYIVDSDL